MSEKKRETRIQDLLNRKRKAGNKQELAQHGHPSTSTAKIASNVLSCASAKQLTSDSVDTKNSDPNGIKEGADAEAEARRKLLEKRAKDKILFEAKRAKERAEQQGPQGWVRPRSLNTNKNFLHRTLASAMFRPESKNPRTEDDHTRDRNFNSPKS